MVTEYRPFDRVSRGDGIIKLQHLLGLDSGATEAGLRVQIAVETEHGHDLGNADAGLGEVGVLGDGLFKQTDGLREVSLTASVPEVAAPQIEVVGLAVGDVAAFEV